jgi:hypothetical protein
MRICVTTSRRSPSSSRKAAELLFEPRWQERARGGRMIVVADTSPLLHPGRIGRLDLLPAVVGGVTVPRTVWSELIQLDADVTWNCAGSACTIRDRPHRGFSSGADLSWEIK